MNAISDQLVRPNGKFATKPQFEPGPPETLHQRLSAAMAGRWARNPKKTSTLDFVSPDAWQHPTRAVEPAPEAYEAERPANDTAPQSRAEPTLDPHLNRFAEMDFDHE